MPSRVHRVEDPISGDCRPIERSYAHASQWQPKKHCCSDRALHSHVSRYIKKLLDLMFSALLAHVSVGPFFL